MPVHFCCLTQCGFLGAEATELLFMHINQQGRQCTYAVTLRHVRATSVAVEKQ